MNRLSSGAAAARAPSRLGKLMTEHERAIAAVLCGVAMTLAGLATLRGPGLTQDSVGYLATGVNFARSDGLRMLADQELTIFPPGLPLIAALGEAIGLGAEPTLRIVSILSFGAMVFLGNRLLRQTVDHIGVVVGATTLLAVSPTLLGISKMAWSEPPFIVIVLLWLTMLSGVWRRHSVSASDLAALCALCWAAFLLRYIGMALIAVSGLTLLAVDRPITMRSFSRVAGFGAAAMAVPLGVMLRNRAADGTILGNRLESHDSIREVVARTAATIGGWLVPIGGLSSRTLALTAMGAAAAVAIGVVTLRPEGSDAIDDGGHEVGGFTSLVVPVLFIVVYVGYLTGAALSTSFEPTNSRYLSPVYIPSVVLAAVALVGVLRRLSSARWRRLIGALAVTFVGAQAMVSIGDARDDAADGIGFNSRGWSESGVASAASDLIARSGDAVVYSNHPNALWAATRMQPIHFAPRDVGFRGAPVRGELDAFAERVSCTEADSYLVVFLLGDDRVMRLAEIRQAVDVRPVATADDGAIFEVTSDRTSACDEAEPRPTELG